MRKYYAAIAIAATAVITIVVLAVTDYPTNHCVARILHVEPEEVAGTDDWPRDLDATADQMMEIWRECR